MSIVIWFVYRLVKWGVFWPFIHLKYRFDVKGRENLPEGGGYILAANHLGRLDTLVLPVFLRQQLSFATKVELYGYPGLKQLLILTGMTPVRRTEASFGELRAFCEQAELVMENGLVFAIFPEGTRSKTKHLLLLEPGTGFLASKTGRSIIPIGLSYTKGSIWRLSRTVVHITIGTPIESVGRKRDDITFELRQCIAELSGQSLVEEND